MISCNITYYNEPKWLRYWYKTVVDLNNRGYDIRLNIADDGSMIHPAEEFFDKHPPVDSMRLFRVTEDIGFNSHGARNLLMTMTETEWNLNSDIDRRYPMSTFEIASEGSMQFNVGNYYSLKEILVASPDGFSVNDYIVHKNDFWKTGGYDEEFVNIHWGDRLFLTNLRQFARRVCRDDLAVKYARKAREVIWADVATTQYPDDNTLIHPNDRWPIPEFRTQLRVMVQNRNKIKELRESKKILNFDWTQIF